MKFKSKTDTSKWKVRNFVKKLNVKNRIRQRLDDLVYVKTSYDFCLFDNTSQRRYYYREALYGTYCHLQQGEGREVNIFFNNKNFFYNL